MKKIIITGGSGGIGKAVAKIFVEKGDKVTLIGRDAKKGETALKELGGKAGFFQGDIRNFGECGTVVQKAAEFLGGVDILINSAGVYLEKPIIDVDENDYANIMDTNFKGTFFITRAALPYLMKNKSSSVVNIASDAGLRGNYGCSLYAASKGAVIAFTKSLALELASFNIRVNAVAPGDALTPMTENQIKGDRERLLKEMASIYPLKRIATPEEIAEVVAFLASDKASFATGAVWSVDGGITA